MSYTHTPGKTGRKRRIAPLTRGIRVQMSPEMRKLLNNRRHKKRYSEEEDVEEVLKYIDDKATELAVKYGRTRRRYLEQFHIKSTLRQSRKTKTSAWSAFLHFKGSADNAIGTKSTIADLVKGVSEYRMLTKEQRDELIMEFDKVKSELEAKRMKTVTARTRAAEAGNSFTAICDELNTVKKRVGIEAFIMMVRSSSDFNMDPKVYCTSDIAARFLNLYMKKDPMVIATQFESAAVIESAIRPTALNYRSRIIRAKAAIRSALQLALVQITNNAHTVMEYHRYETNIVQQYHVKLVGWTHTQWANPSDLKGGLEPLEALAAAISPIGSCKFVAITEQEVAERKRRIARGEVLTPDKDIDVASTMPTSTQRNGLLSNQVPDQPTQPTAPTQTPPEVPGNTARPSGTEARPNMIDILSNPPNANNGLENPTVPSEPVVQPPSHEEDAMMRNLITNMLLTLGDMQRANDDLPIAAQEAPPSRPMQDATNSPSIGQDNSARSSTRKRTASSKAAAAAAVAAAGNAHRKGKKLTKKTAKVTENGAAA